MELYLRKITKEDCLFIKEMEADPKTMDYNAGYNVTYKGYNFYDGTIEEDLKDLQENWLTKWVGHEPNRFMGILRRKSDDRRVGKVYFKEKTEYGQEIGIVIKAEFRGNGYASEGIMLLCKKADELGVERLFHQIPNTRMAAIKADINSGFKVIKDNILCNYTKFGEREKEILLIRDQFGK